MIFPNNTEKYSFQKGEWPQIDISASGNIIYQGRPSEPNAKTSQPCWIIKRTEVRTYTDGSQNITIAYSEPNVRWTERASLTYKYC